MSKRFVKMPEVIKRTGLAKPTIYKRIKAGTFPTQYKTGARSIAFLESDIDAWIEECISSSQESQQ